MQARNHLCFAGIVVCQFDGGNLAYNIPAAFELTGKIDLPKLKEAFQIVIDRHESLRTIFKSNTEGDIRQYILPTSEIDFELKLHPRVSTENLLHHLLEEIHNQAD